MTYIIVIGNVEFIEMQISQMRYKNSLRPHYK